MNIFVANLSYKVNDDDLKSLFEEYGTVKSVRVITDKFSGRSKGFGFVEMENEAEASKAIEELNKATFDDKQLSVSVARPKKEGGDRRGGDRRSFGKDRYDDRKNYRY